MFLYKNRGRDWIHSKTDLLHTPYFRMHSLYALATNKGHVSSPVHLFGIKYTVCVYTEKYTLPYNLTIHCRCRRCCRW